MQETPQGAFLLYSNPAREYAILNHNMKNTTGKLYIEVFDAAGRILFSQTLNTAITSIDIPVYTLAYAIY